MKIHSTSTEIACPSMTVDPERESIAATVSNFVTIELRTDDGLHGVGYTGFVRIELIPALHSVLDALADEVVGKDPHAVETVSQELLAFAGHGAPAGLVTRAAAAIDTAMWDIKGKACGVPLYRLLGGSSGTVPAYASGYLWRDYDADRLAETGHSLVEQGFRAMKFRMGAEPSNATEIRRMQSLREAVGDGVDLMVDINQGWDVNRSICMGEHMDACGLYWLEDPIHHQDYDGMAQICDSLATPVATGEYHYGIVPFQHMLERGSVDIVMVDLLRAGGITHWMKAAHLAEGANKPVVSHLAPEILAHCVSAAPNGLIVEHMPWALPLFREPLQIVDGSIELSDRPGLGLEFDTAALARMHPDS